MRLACSAPARAQGGPSERPYEPSLLSQPKLCSKKVISSRRLLRQHAARITTHPSPPVQVSKSGAPKTPHPSARSRRGSDLSSERPLCPESSEWLDIYLSYAPRCEQRAFLPRTEARPADRSPALRAGGFVHLVPRVPLLSKRQMTVERDPVDHLREGLVEGLLIVPRRRARCRIASICCTQA